MTATFSNISCSALYLFVNETLTNYTQGDLSGGFYKYMDNTNFSYIWVARTTPVVVFVDDVPFTFN